MRRILPMIMQFWWRIADPSTCFRMLWESFLLPPKVWRTIVNAVCVCVCCFSQANLPEKAAGGMQWIVPQIGRKRCFLRKPVFASVLELLPVELSTPMHQTNSIQFNSDHINQLAQQSEIFSNFLQVELPALSRFLVKVSPGTLAASTACAVQPSVWCRSVDAWAPWPLKQLPWRQDVFRSSNCGFTSFSWHLFTIFYPLAFWAWLCCF